MEISPCHEAIRELKGELQGRAARSLRENSGKSIKFGVKSGALLSPRVLFLPALLLVIEVVKNSNCHFCWLVFTLSGVLTLLHFVTL